MSPRLPYAYNRHRGLFAPQGRSDVTASISASSHLAALPQLARSTRSSRSMVAPPASVRSPEGGPSTNGDCAAPVSTPPQSAIVNKSPIDRSNAAPAAYVASSPSRKFDAMMVSDDVVTTRAMPSALM